MVRPPSEWNEFQMTCLCCRFFAPQTLPPLLPEEMTLLAALAHTVALLPWPSETPVVCTIWPTIPLNAVFRIVNRCFLFQSQDGAKIALLSMHRRCTTDPLVIVYRTNGAFSVERESGKMVNYCWSCVYVFFLVFAFFISFWLGFSFVPVFASAVTAWFVHLCGRNSTESGLRHVSFL